MMKYSDSFGFLKSVFDLSEAKEVHTGLPGSLIVISDSTSNSKT